MINKCEFLLSVGFGVAVYGDGMYITDFKAFIDEK